MIFTVAAINIVEQFIMKKELPQEWKEIIIYGTISISCIELLLGLCLVYIINKLLVKSRRSTLKSN